MTDYSKSNADPTLSLRSNQSDADPTLSPRSDQSDADPTLSSRSDQSDANPTLSPRSNPDGREARALCRPGTTSFSPREGERVDAYLDCFVVDRLGRCHEDPMSLEHSRVGQPRRRRCSPGTSCNHQDRGNQSAQILC